jgi:hypothetical protein
MKNAKKSVEEWCNLETKISRWYLYLPGICFNAVFWMKRFLKTCSENFPISRRSNYEVYIPCYNCIGFLGLKKGAKIPRILQSRCRQRGQFSLGTPLPKFKGSAIYEIKDNSIGRLLLKMHLSLYRFTFIRMWKLREQLKWNLTFAIVFIAELCISGCGRSARENKGLHKHMYENLLGTDKTAIGRLYKYVLTDTQGGVPVSSFLPFTIFIGKVL